MDLIRPRETALLRIWLRIARFPRLELTALEMLNSRFMVGVLGLVIDDQGRMLFLEHTYKPEHPWALPGGWLKRNEPVETMLERELMEETSFRIEVDRCLAARNCPSRHQLEVYYLCRYISGEFAASAEISDYRFLDPTDLPPEIEPYQTSFLDVLVPGIPEIQAAGTAVRSGSDAAPPSSLK